MTFKTKTYAFLLPFFVVSAVHIFGLLYLSLLAVYTKPFLMISLALGYYLSVKKVNYWVLLALFFSCCGDIFLLDKANYFVFGLGAFLITHILYIKLSAAYLKNISLKNAVIASVPFVFVFFGLIGLLYRNLNEMLVPVVVYGIVISSFGAVALAVFRTDKSTSNLWLLLGAMLFILSDSLIALNTFYEAKSFYPISIMITYILAQLLLCKFFIVKGNTPKDNETLQTPASSALP